MIWVFSDEVILRNGLFFDSDCQFQSESDWVDQEDHKKIPKFKFYESLKSKHVSNELQHLFPKHTIALITWFSKNKDKLPDLVGFTNFSYFALKVLSGNILNILFVFKILFN